MQYVDGNGNVYSVVAFGPNIQTQITPIIAGVIAPGESSDSNLILSSGLPSLTVAATLDQPGVLEITRYLDRQGTIVAAAASSTPMIVDTPLLVTIADTVVFQSFKLTITNSAAPSGGETELNNATPSQMAAVLQSGGV